MSAAALKAPFPYFGGKSSAAVDVWDRLGRPKQYIEPFCGSAAMLLAAPEPASLEVIGDQNFYVANFWRALKFHPDEVWSWQDYPVSHVDLFARHRWLTEPSRTAALRDALVDADWPGDPKIAGWWLWGQCCWIGSGWCDPRRPGNAGGEPRSDSDVSDSGRGTQAASLGQIPHVSDGSSGEPVRQWLTALSRRLQRVRIVHGDWSRCLNHHYGDTETAVFLDPPYKAYEKLYSSGAAAIADAVADWARAHGRLRVALCGHVGDYDMPGWTVHAWSRGRLTYGGDKTTDDECIWFSPACLRPSPGRTIWRCSVKRTALKRRTPLKAKRWGIKYKSPRRLTRPGADSGYIHWLHSQPCCVCGNEGTGPASCWGEIQASHIRKQTGLGLKPPDRQTLAMHQGAHEDWEQRKGVFAGWADGTRWAWAAPLIAESNEAYDRYCAARARKVAA